MAFSPDTSTTIPFAMNIVARPVDKSKVLTVIGPKAGSAGPWSFLTDIPVAGDRLVAPPPHLVAMAGWGACTAVTVTGVAHRGKVPLTGIDIDFLVEPRSSPTSSGFAVHKKLVLHGRLTDAETVKLRRAANFCPVDQLFTKGALELDDHVEWISGDRQAVETNDGCGVSPGEAPWAIPPGEVRSRHLVDTKVQAEDGSLYEGEVIGYVSTKDGSGVGRWIVPSGHSHDGWVPSPVPLVHGAMAASLAASLREAVTRAGLSPEGIRVEIGSLGSGDRAKSQANADAGRIGKRRVTRRVIVPGSRATLPYDVIRAALVNDPLSRAVRSTGLLVGEEMIVI